MLGSGLVSACVGRPRLALILFSAVLVSASVPAAAQTQAEPGTDPPGVEVPALRSEFAKVFRNPDGTLTAEISTHPVHHEKPDGTWAAVDTTLMATSSDGYVWRNVGGPLDVRFAQVATAGAIASVGSEGRSISFGLLGDAAPSFGRVEGSRVTYADVFPGVDLVYESKEDALKELIVLREAPREAVSYRFSVDLAGLTPRLERDGAISLLSPGGEVELFLPAASMADSGVDAQSAEPAFSEDVELELAPAGSEYVLTLTPDLEWLQDPERVYPVEIDPTVTTGITLDTFVQIGITSGQAGSDELKSGTFDGGSTKARSFVKFNLAGLHDKEILSATFSLYEWHSWSCTASQVKAGRVNDAWTGSVNWSTQPTAAAAFDTLNVAKGFSGSCPDGRISFDATGPVTAWTNGAADNHGIRVLADDESANNGWKKFRSEDFGGASTDPKLEVTYNSYPTAVTGCSPAANTISTDTTPTLSCVYNDPDTGDVGHVDYQICSTSTCSSVVLSGEGTLGVDPGDPSPWTVPGSSPLTSATEYWWRARSDDGRPTKGPWSSTRKYTPNQPPAVPTLETPMDEAEVPMITPVLTATDGDSDPIHDADGQPLSYEFEIGELDGSAFTALCSSGWLPTTNTWTAEPGDCALEDGETYDWRARAKDAFQTSAWTTTRALDVRLGKLGENDLWPMWEHEKLAVNLVNGNAVLSLPGPSYATAVGSMSASVTYNSLDPEDRGLGAGWTLDAGSELSSPPSKLIDHGLMDHADGYDAVEIVVPGGESAYYTRVGESNTYISEPGDGSQLSKNEDGTWILLSEDEAIYTFGVADDATDSAGLTSAELASATPGDGKLTYTFSTDGSLKKLTLIEDEAGRQLAFNWNSLAPTSCPGAILCVEGPDGVVWEYVGDSGGGTSGRLVTIDNGTRDLFAVTYEGPTSDRIIKVQNANDLDPTNASAGYEGVHALTIDYDGNGRVDEVSEGPISGQTPDTSTWTFEYLGSALTPRTARPADGRTEVTPPNQQGELSPQVNTSYYDSRGREIESVDVLGMITAEEYDDLDQRVWSEDAEGNRTDFVWDEANSKLLSETGPDPDGGGALGRPVTAHRYDETAIGTTGSAGPPLQGVQASYYTNVNLAGRPHMRKNDSAVDFASGGGWPDLPGGQTTNFSVRWTGNLVVDTAADYAFSAHATDGVRLTVGGVVAIDEADRVGAAATLTSEEPIALSAGTHRVVLEYFAKTTSGAEVELRWTCTLAGCDAFSGGVIPAAKLRPAWMNQTSTVLPTGVVSFSHFADPASEKPDYELKKLGSANVITSYEYDSAGRVVEKVTPNGNASRSIDSGGNLTGSPDLDYATTWEYYGLNELAEPPATCNGDEVEQAGLLESMTHAGMTPTTTVYDEAGRAVSVTSGAGIRCEAHDAEGRITSSKAPTTYGGTTYETLTYTYDPAGQRLSASDGTLTTSTVYNEADHELAKTDSFGAEVAYTYDGEGNVLTRAATPSPSSSTYTTEYEHDAENRLTKVTDPADREYSFTYDDRGNLRAVQYPNETFSWMDHNDAGWLTNMYHRHGTLASPLPGSVPSDASPIADYSYTYDIAGRKTQEVRSGGGLTTETTSYSSYDALGRLAEVVLPGGTCRKYLFDLNANRTEIKEGASCGSVSTVETYAYSTTELDQLASVTETGQPSTSFTYEAGGEAASRGSDDLSWDGRGRHLGGTFGSTSVTYDFDPAGFRRERTAGSQTTRYLNEGLFESDGSGAVTFADVDGPEGDLAHYEGEPDISTDVSYLYYNGHGDLAAEADGSGNRTAAHTYESFGALRSGSSPTDKTSERFTGKWDKKFDPATGLIEMGARAYDSETGRFYSVDPIVGGSCNAYDYACQDPVNAFDLDGLHFFSRATNWASNCWGWCSPYRPSRRVSRWVGWGARCAYMYYYSRYGLGPMYGRLYCAASGRRTWDGRA